MPSDTMRILADQRCNVLVKLRDVEIAYEHRGEVIIDLNGKGNWLRGIEAIGGMLDFSLRRAVLPFVNRRNDGFVVTYDEEVDAAYFTLQYGQRFASLRGHEQQNAILYSHSVNPTGLYLFDAEGGLASIMYSASDAVESVEVFLRLFDYDTSDTLMREIRRAKR
jgi:hypothetical protein